MTDTTKPPMPTCDEVLAIFRRHTGWNGSHAMPDYEAIAHAICAARDAAWDELVRKAVAVEREACAAIAENTWEAEEFSADYSIGWPCYGENSARAIRSRATIGDSHE